MDPTSPTATYDNITSSPNMSHDNYTDYGCWAFHNPEPDLSLSQVSYLYSSIIFIIIGLIGNVLSIAVFSSKGMRTISSNIYLLVLAFSDSMYLISILITQTLTYLRCLYFTDTHLDVFNRSNVICKLCQFMMDLFSDYSTCLIVAFTVERYIACYHAIKFKDICTVHRAKIACGLIFSLIVVYIAPYHYLYMGLHHEFDVCIIDLKHEEIFSILYISEFCLFRVIPVICITVLNVFIIVKVSKMSREKRRRTSSRSSSNNNMKRKKSMKEDKNRQLTIMLILVSTSYIILLLPVLVHFTMWTLNKRKVTKIDQHNLDVFQNYARTLYAFGFAINFFLYTMSGRVFRDQLISMLGLDKCNKAGGGAHTHPDRHTQATHV